MLKHVLVLTTKRNTHGLAYLSVQVEYNFVLLLILTDFET